MNDRFAQMALVGAGPRGLGMAKALQEHRFLPKNSKQTTICAGTGRLRDRAHHLIAQDDGISRLSNAGALSGFSESAADVGC